MKAIVHQGPNEATIEDRDRPTPGPGEALVRVDTGTICGSDAHAFQCGPGYDFIKLPRIMGHEYAGEVVEIGANVDGLDVGQPVVEEPVHACGECFQCRNGQSNVCQDFSITGLHRDGAFCEYIAVDAEVLHPLPASLDLSVATITEPTSIATRAVLEQSDLTAGDRVLIEGPGPIGALVTMIADAVGADVVVSGLERDAKMRLPLLEDLGYRTINVESASLADRRDEFTDGIGFDVVFDTTGHHSGVEVATEHVRKGGEILVVGIPGEPSTVPIGDLVRAEVPIHTSYGSVWRNFEQAIRLLDEGTIDPEPLLDRSVSIDAPTAAFEKFLDAEACKPAFSFN